ncbi:MAG: Crp/Fnr family transcriptional regulator [Bacteroidetes bacterium]|nr:MAG: Crp/Fnr family transcriptional regulator [Bacteroidota bacterium]
MTNDKNWREEFYYLGKELLDEIGEHGTLADIPAKTEVLSEGKYVKVVPLVIKGSIKVFSRYEDKELLLYYIQPMESCIMSFNACLRNEPSNVIGVTEEDTQAILLPADKVIHWIKKYPALNTLFYQQYNVRYSDLLDTINNLLFYKLDYRLMEYLIQKSKITGKEIIDLSHRQIASEMGTAREVVSRILKKLEKENKLELLSKGIKILGNE